MRRCHGLTSGTGHGARRAILTYIPSRGVRVQRSLAYDCHLEHTRIDPGLERLYRFSRAMVLWIFFLKIRHDPLSTINGPDS